MTTSFLLFAATSVSDGATSPWNAYFLTMLAFVGGIFAARYKNDILTAAFGIVALLFGAISAQSIQNNLDSYKNRAEVAELQVAKYQNQQDNIDARFNQLRAERDSLSNLLRSPAGLRAARLQNVKKSGEATVKKTAWTKAASPRPITASSVNLAKGKFARVGKLRDGLAPVKFLAGGWGYINASGRTVVGPEYTMTCELHFGRGGVRNEQGLWGFVDERGRLVIGTFFDQAFGFEEASGQAMVRLGKRWVWINQYGEVIRDAKNSELDARMRYSPEYALW